MALSGHMHSVGFPLQEVRPVPPTRTHKKGMGPTGFEPVICAL